MSGSRRVESCLKNLNSICLVCGFMFTACFFCLFWVWYYIWLQALTEFLCLWNVSPFSMLTPLIFFVCIRTKVCVCAFLRQCVWNIHKLKLIFIDWYIFQVFFFFVIIYSYWEQEITSLCGKKVLDFVCNIELNERSGKKRIVLLVFCWILCSFVPSRHYKHRLPKNINCLFHNPF